MKKIIKLIASNLFIVITAVILYSPGLLCLRITDYSIFRAGMSIISLSRIADETAQQLESVVAGAEGIVKTIGVIAGASRTQADSVAQIQDQIGQISSVVQTNAATAQQSAAASEQLSAQAGLLKKLTERFQLKRYGQQS